MPTEQPAKVIDPDGVQETLCDGRMYINTAGNVATLTLTHPRPRPAELFDDKIILDDVIRSRIVMSIANWAALRDLLIRVIRDDVQSPTATSGSGTTKH